MNTNDFRRLQKRWGCLLLALVLAGGTEAMGQVGGNFVSAIAFSPITPGQPLDVNLVVSNDTTEVWMAGEEFPFSWMATVYDMPWSPGTELDYISETPVYPGGTARVIARVDPAFLPTAPGTYSFQMAALWNFLDVWLVPMNNSPRTVTFTINPVNHAPVIAEIQDKVVVDTNLLSFTVSATDTDTPPQTLTFALGPGAPSEASISSAGVFSWRPPAGYAPRTNQISVTVTDSGSPPMSATNTFRAIVLNPLRFQPPAKPSGGAMRLVWESYPGKTYRVRYRDNLISGVWTNVDVLATGALSSVTNVLGATRQRYYQLLLMD